MNFKGLVNLHTLPVTMPLLPLYEAVINSIQSIEDANKEGGNISAKLEDEKGEFNYTGYVMSDILDKSVNRERTKFELPEQQNLVDDVGIEEIFEKLKKKHYYFYLVIWKKVIMISVARMKYKQ